MEDYFSSISFPAADKNFIFQLDVRVQVLSRSVYNDLVFAFPKMARRPKYFSNETLRGSSVGQDLDLLPNSHQFEYPQGHWRFIWPLTSEPHGISQGVRKLT